MSRHSIPMRLLAMAVLFMSLFFDRADAQQAQLQQPDARITDGAIQADYQTYEALQSRIKALNDGGRPVRDYPMSKAQCWLDVSFHEYTRNDRSAFPQEALSESEKLIVAMEGKQSPIPMDTALVNGAAKLRPDLWSKADAIKGSAGFRCAEQKTACAEVELVHAGNEYNQQQWRHAKPYVQIAEDLIAEASALAERCTSPAAPAAPAVAAPTKEELLLAQVMFRFDRSSVTDILPASRDQLDELVSRLRNDKSTVRSIRLVGHADRLNGTGDASYNQRLSEERSVTVRDLLVSKGFTPSSIDISARGAERPVESCNRPFASKAELEACLLPNRRVDVEIRIGH